jgi:hypothetical protein
MIVWAVPSLVLTVPGFFCCICRTILARLAGAGCVACPSFARKHGGSAFRADSTPIPNT